MGSDSKYSAPADAEEFYRQDGEYVHGLVRKLGNYQNGTDAQDDAAYIIGRLLTPSKVTGKTVLEQYDPGHVSEHNGKPVTWRAFLSNKVNLYMRGRRESAGRRAGREVLLCDAPAGETGTRWVELFGPAQWDDYEELSDAQVWARFSDYIAALPETWDGPVSLFAVFNEVIELVKSGELNARPGIQQRFGLSKSQASDALARLGEAVQEAAAAQPPLPREICGVVLSASEVRDALDRLKAATGNHVHRALAGHRLQEEAPKGWYHEAARAELSAYPEVSGDIAHGKIGGAGTGHVKGAVIHLLERMLAGEAAPEDELSPAELLEFELFHIPGLQPVQVAAVLRAVEKVYA